MNKLRLCLKNNDFFDTYILYKNEHNNIDEYNIFIGHSFILSSSEYLNKIFKRSKPEAYYTNNKYYNLYKLHLPMKEEIFKLSIEIIHMIFLKEDINDDIFNEYDDIIYSELLYCFDFLIVNEECMYTLLKICYDNINKIQDKKNIFNTIIELQTIDKKYKNFFYRYFYDVYDELRDELSINNIIIDDYLIHQNKYLKSNDKVVINCDLIKDNSIYCGSMIETENIVYVLYYINKIKKENKNEKMYTTYICDDSTIKKIDYNYKSYINTYSQYYNREECGIYKYFLTSYLKSDLDKNTSDIKGFDEKKIDEIQFKIKIYIDVYDLEKLTVIDNIPINNYYTDIDKLESNTNNGKLFNAPNDFYDTPRHSYYPTGYTYDRNRFCFESNRNSNNYSMQFKIIKEKN